jgi:hypothetical protein
MYLRNEIWSILCKDNMLFFPYNYAHSNARRGVAAAAKVFVGAWTRIVTYTASICRNVPTAECMTKQCTPVCECDCITGRYYPLLRVHCNTYNFNWLLWHPAADVRVSRADRGNKCVWRHHALDISYWHENGWTNGRTDACGWMAGCVCADEWLGGWEGDVCVFVDG